MSRALIFLELSPGLINQAVGVHWSEKFFEMSESAEHRSSENTYWDIRCAARLNLVCTCSGAAVFLLISDPSMKIGVVSYSAIVCDFTRHLLLNCAFLR